MVNFVEQARIFLTTFRLFSSIFRYLSYISYLSFISRKNSTIIRLSINLLFDAKYFSMKYRLRKLKKI